MARAFVWVASCMSCAVALQIPDSVPRDGQCIVFHSQHKAAGNDVEAMFLNYWRRSSLLLCDRSTWDCQTQTCADPDFMPDSDDRTLMKGYVQVLAGSEMWGHAGDGRCTWATMSRNPVARLVSAYLYCKHGTFLDDPLCGSKRLDSRKASLREFAVHWGNFLFREFLWFPQLRALAESRPDFKATTFCPSGPQGLEEYMDPWVAFKDQLNGGDTLETESGKKNLDAVKNHLIGRNGAQRLYDVIGVLEDTHNTIRLFHHFMPHNPWESTFLESTRIDHGSEQWEAEKAPALKQASTDPVIQRAIAADIELYSKVIVPLFSAEVANLPAMRQ